MYMLVKEIRNTSFEELKLILSARVSSSEDRLNGITSKSFQLHKMNKPFVKYLLSRVYGFIDSESGLPTNFATYFVKSDSQDFEIEHIWSKNFDKHRDEFEQRHEFDAYRNHIGALLLLQRGLNQSLSDDSYEDKLNTYNTQGLYGRTLHPECYTKNPNFMQMIVRNDLPFRAHPEFKKGDIHARQQLVERICQKIWNWQE